CIRNKFRRHSVICVIFFFSSRRRHTRSKRDWSSDVCSSDLTGEVAFNFFTVVAAAILALAVWLLVRPNKYEGVNETSYRVKAARSEERRVGKECRTRAEGDHWKNTEGEEVIRMERKGLRAAA